MSDYIHITPSMVTPGEGGLVYGIPEAKGPHMDLDGVFFNQDDVGDFYVYIPESLRDDDPLVLRLNFITSDTNGDMASFDITIRGIDETATAVTELILNMGAYFKKAGAASTSKYVDIDVSSVINSSTTQLRVTLERTYDSDDRECIFLNGRTLYDSEVSPTTRTLYVAGYEQWYVTDHCLVDKWNGKHFVPVYQPDPSGNAYSVHGSGTDDVWVVGVELARHWNGSVWTSYDAQQTAYLTGNQCYVAPNGEAWAAGHVSNASGNDACIWHFNGSTWSQQYFTSGRHGFYGGCYGFADDDVWAFGGDGSSPLRGSLIMHYNGTSWSSVSHSNFGYYALGGYGLASDYMWVCGASRTSGQPVVQLWNGSAFTTLWAPATTRHMECIWGAAEDDVWTGGSNGLYHYNGSTWTNYNTYSGTLPPGGGIVNGIWGFASDDIFAGDHYGNIIHWDGTQWDQVACSANVTEWSCLWGID